MLLRGPLAQIRQKQRSVRKELKEVREEISRLRKDIEGLRKGSRIFDVPEKFNKNSPNVVAMGTPAETGAMLIEYMCHRLGCADLGNLDVLDFGCGCRFADAIVNKKLAIGSYTGIDIDREMIEFLSRSVSNPNMRFYHWNVRNPGYNPDGEPLTDNRPLPIDEQTFDLICMFSVITHQVPEDAENIFRILRRHIRPGGRLFFSANIQEMDDDYRELEPDRPTAHSAYSAAFLKSLLNKSGWKVLTLEGKSPPGQTPIQDSLLCEPV